MIETPRTDDELRVVERQVVSAEFARGFERELTNANNALMQCRELLMYWVDAAASMKEELARLKNG